MNGWPSMPKKIPSKTLREFRGINKLDKFSIGDAYATEMSNITSDNYPSFSTRGGYSLLGSAFAQKILGLGTHKNSELHAVSDGSWYKYSGGSWSAALASGLSTSAEYSFANFDGSFADIQLISANGVDAMKTYDGATVANLGGTPPANANYVINYMNRLFVAVGNLVHASELNIATSWTVAAGNDTDPYQISVDTLDGETICSLKPGIGHVTIFKPNSMHELYGSDPSNVRIEPITFEIGAINNKCITTLNGTMYMIHRTGIYRYAGGTRPARDFSSPVQFYLDNINTTAMSMSSCGTDGSKVYFSIPMDSSTAPDTILVYDPKFDMWTVWKDFNVLHFAQSSDSFYMGMSDGKVIKLGGLTDNGTPISGYRISKPFSADQISRKIRWLRMWLVCDVPVGSSLSVFVSPSATGDSDWVTAGSITPSSAVQSARIIFSPSQLAQSNYLRIKWTWTGPVTVFEWDRDEIDFPIV